MYMYPVLTSNPSELSSTNTNSTTALTTSTTTNMPRNRSASSASGTSPPPPALITRGFQSLRRAHRRLSNSSPSSPIPLPQEASNASEIVFSSQQHPTDNSTISSTRPSAESADSGNSNNNSNNVVRPRMRLVPNVGISSRSFVFEIIDRELEPGVIYRIGRFSDRNALSDRLSFKSKVVSRNHAELWTEQGKVKYTYIIMSNYIY
jgi:hypothetical protein